MTLNERIKETLEEARQALDSRLTTEREAKRVARKIEALLSDISAY